MNTEEIANFKHEFNIRPRFSDFDMLGHVNNTRYLSYMEDARIKYLEHILNTPLTQVNTVQIVAHLDIDFKIPVLPGDSVKVFTRTIEIGSKSLRLESLVVGYPDGKEDSPQIAAKGSTILVSYSQSAKQAVEHPQELVNGIKNYEKVPVKEA